MPRKQSKEEVVPPEERCLNRLTSEKTIQLFGDGVHKFFLEMRCTSRRIEGRPICLECSMPNTSKKQYARTFPRGLIHEPLPPTVHLYDSEWYHQRVKTWGAPSEDVIALAKQYQQEARKVLEPSQNNISMPPRRKPVVKKPEVAPPNDPEPIEQKREEELSISQEISKEQVKKIRRPRIKKQDDSASVPPMESSYPPSTSTSSSVLELFQQEEREKQEEKEEKGKKEEKSKKGKKEPKEKKERKPRASKKTESAAESAHPLSTLHRDFCIPTHLEEKIEELAVSDYETETVPLTVFILDNTVYFRDAKKNKLYRRIKEKTIGPYIGRYDPQTDSLVTDIPDSDDEE